MTNQSVIQKVISKVRVAAETIMYTIEAGLHRTDIDEQLPPNVERHGRHLLVRVMNEDEHQRR